MKEPEWSRRELESTSFGFDNYSRHACIYCGRTQDRDNIIDVRVPNEPYLGTSYCPKHAELLKEAQWRYHNEGRSVP